MNSLEDAYVNMAKAEEKLHQGEGASLNMEMNEEDFEAKFRKFFDFVGNPRFV
jgi:hypothetical protein